MTTSDEDRRAQLLGYFYEESAEGLEAMESSLLEIDIAQPDSEQINAIFRAIHSIKGSGGSFGLDDISRFAHHAETLLDEIRAGDRQLTKKGVDVLLHSTDCLRDMIEAMRDGKESDQDRVEEITGQLLEMLEETEERAPEASQSLSVESAIEPASASPNGTKAEWEIRFAPHRHLLRTGNEPVRILRELESLGELKVTADPEELESLDDMDPEDCYLSWDLSLCTDASEEVLREVFAWVEEDCDLEIRCLSKTVESVTEDANADSNTAEDAKVEPSKAAAAKSSGKSGARAASGGGSIRVSTEKIDALVNMVGELVITQAMLGEVGDNFDENRLEALREGLGQLARNTRELQDNVMRIRMLPVSVTFNRFPRLVHDLSQKLGKRVELVLIGEATEVDKTVLEKLADPLVHLIRNSLDHGLEKPDQRVAAGKSETGKIVLNAFHQGGNIVIEVGDDGGGLDPDRIRAKALKNGLITEEDNPTDSQLFDMLFQAGFSTAEKVSDVSGRGVGLDVVRRNIRELGGTVAVDSTKGVGSTFTIRLPLTLAILDGQLVRIGSETFVIPLISIVESLQIKPEFVNVITGSAEIYRLREEAIPIVRLYDLFDVLPDRQGIDNGLLVVVEGSGSKSGLLVDDLLGQQQVVIKSLKDNFGDVPGLAGATILGDGTVALIVDIAGLIELAKNRIPEASVKTGEVSRSCEAVAEPAESDSAAQGDSQ
ncbi:MAG: chemotaxis protein CheA [bacterium]|nr:chemotaxis protein CheA [bacterium]